jgi:hypothetical protein
LFVALEPLAKSRRCLACVNPARDHLAVEFLDPVTMFLQVASFETKPLNISEHWKQQITNCGHKAFELIVKRVLPEFIIQVPDQMNKTFLLLTEQSVVSAVKIGDDRAIEIRKQRP